MKLRIKQSKLAEMLETAYLTIRPQATDPILSLDFTDPTEE
jgi:DNA polymerase III sliding clamp (beta) subunit (PCNA family)